MIARLGLVLECDAGGPDELVLSCLARRLSPGTEVICATMGSKPGIFQRGVEAAQELVESSGCDLALIVWDLKPLWGGPPPAESCRDEAAELREKLRAVPGRTRDRIRLLCFTYELESWLIADERAINAYLSTPAHPTRFRSVDPLSQTDAKALLISTFRKWIGRRYEDYREAIRLAQLLPDTNRLAKLPSFRRFLHLLTGDAAVGFQTDGKACADLVYQAARLGQR